MGAKLDLVKGLLGGASKSVVGFFSSPLKSILTGVAIGGVIALYLWIGSLKDAAQDAQAEKARAVAEAVQQRDNALMEAKQAKNTLEAVQAQQEALALISAKLLETQENLDHTVNEWDSIFKEHDIAKIQQRHPKMLEKRINNATAEKISELQEAINNNR